MTTSTSPKKRRPAARKPLLFSATQQQERIATLRARSDAAQVLAREFQGQNKAAITELNELLLASQINDVLQDFDPRVLKELMTDKPELFFRLASAINAQAAERLRREKAEFDLQKYRDHVEEQKRKIEEAATQSKTGGLTPETLQRIEEAAKLL